MTKILYTSDWHVDAMTAGVSRYAEIEAYVNELASYVQIHGVDVVCFLGDAFDKGSMREGMWSRFMFNALYSLTNASRLGSVWIPGNHDVIDSSTPCSTLSPLATAVMHYGNARFGPEGKKVRVCEMPELITFGDSIAVLALPYVSRLVERSEPYRCAFDASLEQARVAKGMGRRTVSIGHYALPGAVPGSEEEMMQGRDIVIPARALRAVGLDAVVNGHYHARQTINVDGLAVEVVGAPARFTFGESHDGARGFLVSEF